MAVKLKQVASNLLVEETKHVCRWSRSHASSVRQGDEDMWARERVNSLAKFTWVHKRGKHFDKWARKHANNVGTWARKQARHVSTWTCKHGRHVGTRARNPVGHAFQKTYRKADRVSYLIVFEIFSGIVKPRFVCITRQLFFPLGFQGFFKV